jgi:hypothetical protein
VVVDTPHFAVTDIDGRFEICDVPAGDYAVSVWHPESGKLPDGAGPREITLTRESPLSLAYKVKAPLDVKE